MKKIIIVGRKQAIPKEANIKEMSRAKPKGPKFEVGQIVMLRKHNRYDKPKKIIALKEGLAWDTDGHCWHQERLRPLTRREIGPHKKGSLAMKQDESPEDELRAYRNLYLQKYKSKLNKDQIFLEIDQLIKNWEGCGSIRPDYAMCAEELKPLIEKLKSMD